MADALWEGLTLLKSGQVLTDGRTDTRAKVKTVYLPVSLHSLGGYNKCIGHQTEGPKRMLSASGTANYFPALL